MELKIRAGKRILYKQNNSGWKVGELYEGNAEVTPLGLFLPILPKKYFDQKEDPEEIDWAEFDNIFWEAFQLEDWIKDYKTYFMTKDEYIQFIESEDFDKNRENAYVSDGEYGYYPVTKFNKTWISKQPFDYIVRGD